MQAFTEVPMTPEEGRLREAADALLRLERDIFALWCRWLYQPLDAAGEARARAAFEQAMAMVDGALAQVGGGGPFLLGSEVSLVDLMFVPFLERQNASLLYWKGFKLRNGGYANIDRCGPTVLAFSWGRCCGHEDIDQGGHSLAAWWRDTLSVYRWFEALEARSTYAATQSDYYTHCWDIPPQYGTCWPAPDTEQGAMAINGTDGSSWKLPLAPLSATSFEARSNADEGGLVRSFLCSSGCVTFVS